MNKFGIQLIALLAACVILFIIAQNLIAEHAVPSLGEFMASSTEQGASSTEKEVSSTENATNATSSLNLLTPNSLLLTSISVPAGVIHAEIADTDASREQGLSDRASLPADNGMLFVFDTPGQYGFWMKDMRFPLDMVWINADKTVAGVTKDILPSTYPSIFPPPSSISYVLEINAGSAEKFGLVSGAIVDFTLPSK